MVADVAPLAPINPMLAGRVPGASYNTALDPGMEQFFRMWVRGNNVPFDPDATGPQDYDMRGFYRALIDGDPKAQSAMNGNDGRLHYPDFWKTPLHSSFSNESQWAAPDAPQWNDADQLVQGGRVLLDERRNAEARLEPFGMVAP